MVHEELKVTIVLKEPISFREIGEQIGSFLHFAMLQDEDLKKKHKEKNVKHYVYSHLYPTEKDGIYKPGIGYVFRLRSIDLHFLNKMKVILKNIEHKLFILLKIENQTIPISMSNGVKTLTPFVITLENSETKYWKVNESREKIEDLLTKNIANKYRQWTGKEKVNDLFIKEVKMLNQKPTYYVYKNRKMLANKAVVLFHDDPLSQQIKDFCVRTGIGEKSSVLGSGFSETF